MKQTWRRYYMLIFNWDEKTEKKKKQTAFNSLCGSLWESKRPTVNNETTLLSVVSMIWPILRRHPYKYLHGRIREFTTTVQRDNISSNSLFFSNSEMSSKVSARFAIGFKSWFNWSGAVREACGEQWCNWSS